jgi:hypothetical protein
MVPPLGNILEFLFKVKQLKCSLAIVSSFPPKGMEALSTQSLTCEYSQ